MQQKTVRILGILSLISICGCCFAGLIWDGSLLPFKVCRPINYPRGTRDGLKEGKWFSLTTSDETSEVISFYDQRLLDGQHFLGGIYLGEWQREELANGKWLYSCYGNDINGITTETGCVYVRQHEEGVLVESDFFRSEGGHTPCLR